MKKILWLPFVIISCSLIAQKDIPNDIYKSNKTYTHEEIILKYLRLEKENPEVCKLVSCGKSDCGKNLHLFVINKSGKFEATQIDRTVQNVLLINNAIHPGEPCGVDASIKLARELVRNPKKLPDNLVITIVPIYNIGGASNRNCCSRANQNGPEEYGFRGNARNLDLNRDFIKCDSENARAFVGFFRAWNPDVFVDTHTSNGADYQHVMTLITTQTDKLNPVLSEFVVNQMRPHLLQEMEKKKYPVVPYVHTIKKTPDNGIKDYLETPRYSTGYAATFNCIGFVTEAHMLKPFSERVESTYMFLKILVDYMNNQGDLIRQKRSRAIMHTIQSKTHYFNYKLDTTRFDSILFHGYTAKYKPSLVSGTERLFYDQTEPYSKFIRYYRYYYPTDSVVKPRFYVVPQAWREVVELLQMNKVQMTQLDQDSTMILKAYYIDSFQTVNSPYEGHYLHYNIKTTKKETMVTLYQGDYLIPMGRETDIFVMEVLEPFNSDSYFAWNFFDEILMQKEWFSPYVFEEKALEILESNPGLKKEFEQKKLEDPEFTKDGFLQLLYIFKHSDNYEKTHNRYPVYRIER